MKPQNKKFNILIFSISIFIILSCSRERINKNVTFIDFSDAGMTSGFSYTFFPFENFKCDSINPDHYKIEVIIRYTDKCQVKSLPLMVETSSYNNEDITLQNISVELFDDNMFSHNGSLGFYEKSFTLLSNQRFDDGLGISISTPEKHTNGIISLGVQNIKEK